jgi:hypothetical protein
MSIPKNLRALPIAITLLLTTPLLAQDAASVLTRYLQVTGGPDLYKHYNAIHVFYTATLKDKSTLNVDFFHTRDGKTLTETDTGNATLDSGISDNIAWKYSEAKGAQILSGKEAARMLAESKGFDEDDWHLRYPTIALLTNQTINGVPCRHLKLTRTDGSTLERFYEIKSGLLVREVSTQFDDAGIAAPSPCTSNPHCRTWKFRSTTSPCPTNPKPPSPNSRMTSSAPSSPHAPNPAAFPTR